MACEVTFLSLFNAENPGDPYFVRSAGIRHFYDGWKRIINTAFLKNIQFCKSGGTLVPIEFGSPIQGHHDISY